MEENSSGDRVPQDRPSRIQFDQELERSGRGSRTVGTDSSSEGDICTGPRQTSPQSRQIHRRRSDRMVSSSSRMCSVSREKHLGQDGQLSNCGIGTPLPKCARGTRKVARRFSLNDWQLIIKDLKACAESPSEFSNPSNSELSVERASEDLLAIGNESGVLPLVETDGADVMNRSPAVAHDNTAGFASHAAFTPRAERVSFVVDRAMVYRQDDGYLALGELDGQ